MSLRHNVMALGAAGALATGGADVAERMNIERLGFEAVPAAYGDVTVEGQAPAQAQETTDPEFEHKMEAYCEGLIVGGTAVRATIRGFGNRNSRATLSGETHTVAEDADCDARGYGEPNKVVRIDMVELDSDNTFNESISQTVRVSGNTEEDFKERLPLERCDKGQKERTVATRIRTWFEHNGETVKRTQLGIGKKAVQLCKPRRSS